MKKFIGSALLFVSAIAFVPSAEAKSASTAMVSGEIEPQYVQYRRNNRRTVRTYTRNVRSGRAIYRETYRVVYRPNGTTRTQLISRVRIGRY